MYRAAVCVDGDGVYDCEDLAAVREDRAVLGGGGTGAQGGDCAAAGRGGEGGVLGEGGQGLMVVDWRCDGIVDVVKVEITLTLYESLS